MWYLSHGDYVPGKRILKLPGKLREDLGKGLPNWHLKNKQELARPEKDFPICEKPLEEL